MISYKLFVEISWN